MAEWPKSRLLAAQYQTPFHGGIGFAQYASSGTVTPELWENIRRIESDAEQNPGAPEVEGWAEDMVTLRAALHEEGIPEYVQVTLEWRNDHGLCVDCAQLPASYLAPDLTYTHMDPRAVVKGQKLCPVCAALHASHGEKLERLWKDDDEDEDAVQG